MDEPFSQKWNIIPESTGHLPFCALTAVIGAGIGAIIGGITAAKSGNSVWKGAVKGAVVGGLIGLGAGAGAGAMLAGNVGASTSAVIAGGKLCASYVSSGGVSSGVTYVSNNISSYGKPASTMQQVSQRGKMGEAIAGITKNKEHIPSMTGTADYRIPDGFADGVLSEVKNYTGTLYYTNQLRDFVMYVQNTPGMKMHLYTNAKLSGPLQELVNNGTIQLFPLK